MSAEEVLRAVEHYRLSVFAPTPGTGVKPGSEWLARSGSGEMLGFGATPSEAVAAAVQQVAESG